MTSPHLEFMKRDTTLQQEKRIYLLIHIILRVFFYMRRDYSCSEEKLLRLKLLYLYFKTHILYP